MSLLIFFPLLMVSLTTLEWTERAAMPRGEAGGAVAFLDGELVIAGGTTWERGIKVWLTDTQVYQPASNRWVPGRQLPVPLAYGPFISSASGLEIFGGTDGKANHQTSWKLHAANKAWERTGSVPAGVLLGRAAYVDGSAF